MCSFFSNNCKFPALNMTVNTKKMYSVWLNAIDCVLFGFLLCLKKTSYKSVPHPVNYSVPNIYWNYDYGHMFQKQNKQFT